MNKTSSYTNYIIGAVVWICIPIIGCIVYIKLAVLSSIQYLLPSSHTAIKNVADCMSAIVSEYGFREETVDISGVSVHCVIKDVRRRSRRSRCIGGRPRIYSRNG